MLFQALFNSFTWLTFGSRAGVTIYKDSPGKKNPPVIIIYIIMTPQSFLYIYSNDSIGIIMTSLMKYATEIQSTQVYCVLNVLSVFVLPTQQQTNGVDCSCYAIATAVEFLTEDGDPLAVFDTDQMR